MSNNNTLIGQLLVPMGSGMTMSFPAEIGNVIEKYITNYIRENNITGAIDSTGNEYTLFSDEFYYRAVSSAYGLSRMTIYGSDDYDKIQRSPDFEFIRDNLTKVKNLDISLQEYIWVKFLLFLSMGGEEFQTYYTLCPAEVKSLYSVQKIEYLYRINNDIGSINADDMLEFGVESVRIRTFPFASARSIRPWRIILTQKAFTVSMATVKYIVARDCFRQ